MTVVYEDNHIIVVNKTASEIVQADKTGDTPLSETVKQYLKEKYQKPGNVFLGVTHRLDRPVSGLVIFAKTSKALTRLNEMFRTSEVKKTYWAVVKNAPQEPEGELVHFLVRNEKQNKSYAYDKEVPNSKKAILHYRLIGHSENYYLLEVDLKTGRHHQIRCQLAKMGCPIKGDLKYGSPRSNPDGSICLHARITAGDDESMCRRLKKRCFAVRDEKGNLYLNCRKLRYKKLRFGAWYAPAVQLGKNIYFCAMTLGSVIGGNFVEEDDVKLGGNIGDALAASSLVTKRVCYELNGETGKVDFLGKDRMLQLLKNYPELKQAYLKDDSQEAKHTFKYLLELQNKQKK